MAQSVEDIGSVSDSSSNEDFPESPQKRQKLSPIQDSGETLSAPSRIRRKIKSQEDDVQREQIRIEEPSTKPLEDFSFQGLGVDSWIIASLSSMQITRPTPIQAQTIPAILAGSDCIGGSRTGSGKTVAFSVPILQRWAEDGFGVYALILTPTRLVTNTGLSELKLTLKGIGTADIRTNQRSGSIIST
jgi:ATP-dependent RNA helicase DDX49/DBP8